MVTLDELPEVGEILNKAVSEKHDDLLRQAIEMITGKPFDISDAKRCTIVYHPDLQRPDYYLAFDNIHVGLVHFEFCGASFSVTFMPSKKYN